MFRWCDGDVVVMLRGCSSDVLLSDDDLLWLYGDALGMCWLCVGDDLAMCW